MANREEQLSIAKDRLTAYLKAEETILINQEYWMGSKRFRRADLEDVQSKIKELQNEIARLEAGGKNKMVRVVPIDL
ncbi:DUF6148 family protein [Anaerocolumna sp. AGMB13025]|uniref:DUF6148 family protein n=1 Tax=Anaerocolumna sp. AGMB13025 TaxID=3039116 RepID=UPI00241BFAE4|nr:DUF6148 family protein [Anaerocolumna sp. AGMB13025]WFR55367.1 DUF6148 family protein [Anaerocolumna sp. AGMB13025]